MIKLGVSLILTSLVFPILGLPLTEFYSDPSNYVFFPVSSQVIKIQLRTGEASDIMLSTSNSSSETNYEIQIGHTDRYQGGSYSRILKNKVEKVKSMTPNVLNADSKTENTFIIFWIQQPVILIGAIKKGGSCPFLIWEDTTTVTPKQEISHVGFRMSQASGSDDSYHNSNIDRNVNGYWRVEDIHDADVSKALKQFMQYINPIGWSTTPPILEKIIGPPNPVFEFEQMNIWTTESAFN